MQIIERITQADKEQATRATPAAESAVWMSAIVEWLFDTMHQSPAVRDGIFWESFADSVEDIKRTKLAYILKDVKLEKIAIGASLPRISHIQVLQASGTDLPLTIVMEMDYDGGVGAVVNFETIFGIRVWIMERLAAIEGTLYVCFLDKVCYYGFSPLKRLELEAQICIGAVEWRRLGWFLAKFVFPWMFRRKWLMPAMKAKWLYDKPPLAK